MSADPIAFSVHPLAVSQTQIHRGYELRINANQATPTSEWTFTMQTSLVSPADVDDVDESFALTMANSAPGRLPRNEVLKNLDLTDPNRDTEVKALAVTLQGLADAFVKLIPTPEAPSA